MMILAKLVSAKHLVRPIQRTFFRELGIADCNETDVLVAIKDGIYTRSAFIQSSIKANPTQPIDKVVFDENGRLTIYDYSD